LSLTVTEFNDTHFLTDFTSSRLDVISVGANLGFFGLLAAAMGCRAVLVEPQPHLVDYIHLSLAINSGFADRVRVFQNIINDPKASDQKLYIDLRNKNVGGRRTTSNATQCAEHNSCAVVRSIGIDDIVDIEIQEPDLTIILLKVDCEGYEPDAIKSARKVLSRTDRVVVENIIMEFNLHHMHGGAEAAREMLESLYGNGYEMQDIKQSPRRGWIPRTELESFMERFSARGKWTDLWFRRRSAASDPPST